MVSSRDNSEWIRALCRQEHEAFADLLALYGARVAACGRRCGLGESEVEDVVSSTFLKAYQALPGYRGEAAVGTWLCRIAYHQSIDVIRQLGNDRCCREAVVREDPVGDPIHSLEWDEVRDRLEGALSRLPCRWLEAITLRYWNYMSIAQIARVMHVSEVAVRSYLFRGRRQLRLWLET